MSDGIVPNYHASIYRVHLELQESMRWESSQAYRDKLLAGYFERARAVGKKRVEVHGRYCQLGTYEVTP